MKKYIKSTSDTFKPERIPWDQYISQDVLDRLSDCRSRRSDLPILRDAIWQYIQDNDQQGNWTLQDAAELALEWVGDWNNQYNVTDITDESYRRFMKGGRL